MSTRGLLVLVAVFVTACLPTYELDEIVEAPESDPELEGTTSRPATSASLAVLAGVGGTVNTLDRYDDGGSHPGTNAIDVGAPGGTAVWHQLDYLPEDIAGGWLYVQEAHEAGYCSQWYPGSPYYNGAKIYVWTFLYDTSGTSAGWHRAAYQHVDPDGAAMDRWSTWNNARGASRAWESADVVLGNLSEGGLRVGGVTSVSGYIYNGSGGGLCTTGSHLHQEAAGSRAPQRWVGESVTGRYNDLQYFQPSGGTPSFPGAPPSSPGEVDEEPPADDPDPPDDPPPADPCGGITWEGACSAGVLTWCQDESVRTYDCAASGLGCGWQDASIGNNCVHGCGELDYAGGCVGDSLRWCQGDSVRTYDCGAIGMSCGWQDNSVGFNCVH